MFDPFALVDESWLWLGGSLLIAILWSNLHWLFHPVTQAPVDQHTSSVDRFVTRLVAWRFSSAIFRGLRLFYYVGVPFAALLWGHDALVGRLMGLQRLELPTSAAAEVVTANWQDWASDLGWATALGLAAWLLLVLGWRTYRRALQRAEVEALPVAGEASGGGALREAAYHELHWAFYRNAPAMALGPYWGTWVGLALVALEAVLNPNWRDGVRHPRQAPALLIRGALAVVSSVFFLLTQNLWIALLLHWSVFWGAIAVWRRRPVRAADQARSK